MNSKISYIKIDEIKSKIQKIDSDLILVITDINVWGLYSKKIPILNIEGKKVIFWKAPDGEKVKTMENLNSAVEFFLSRNIHRKAHMIALGGGATSDFTGMVASILLRGIKWSVIPTTLLSMVDAGIGGKVAVNSVHGKNLIGAFHHPENIWISDDFLETLPKEEFQSGLGELLKYGFLSKKINTLINKEAHLSELIKECVSFKEEVVTEDFKEAGRRKILNFGHTIGHALEQVYSLSHGVAVVWGMLIITKLFQKNNDLSELKKMIECLKIETGESPWLNKSFPVSQVMELVKKDKKSVSSSELDIVLAEEIGKPSVEKVTFSKVEETLIGSVDELRKLTL